ncbi:MAG: VOC family protein [Gemmatimonadales bacterium]
MTTTPATPQTSPERPRSTTSPVPRGRFVWYELLTTDPSSATTFYSKVMGWSTEPWKGSAGGPPYTMWMNAGKSIGGLMLLPEEAKAAGAPPHWLGYVTVSDTDAAVALATRRGAQVHMGPIEIPEVGRMAVIADPQGASISLFTPTMPGTEPSAKPPVGTVSWHELATTDWKKAWDFYQELFGWEKGQAMDMGAMGTYQIFTVGGIPNGAMFDRPPEIPVSNWLYYFRVADLDAAMAATKANGGKILNGPMDVPGGRIAQCLDLQGAAFALHWITEG